MKPLIVNDTTDAIPEKFISTWVSSLAKELCQRQLLSSAQDAKEISVVFLKPSDAKQLNWTYRQRDYATDILSFETEDPDSFGELILCPEVLRKQAQEHKMSFEAELGYMILHGVLHLLGFDHEKGGAESEKMLALQDEIFKKLTQPIAKKKTVDKVKKTVAKKASKRPSPRKK